MNEEFVQAPSPDGLIRPAAIGWGAEEQGQVYSSLSFDPGGTTGWAVFAVHKQAMYSTEYRIMDNILMWSCGELVGPEGSQVEQMRALAEAWEEAKVIVEDFDVRQPCLGAIGSSSPVLSPIRIAQQFKGLVAPRPIIWQLPAAMVPVSDERLQSWGFGERTRGKPHARDAVRHNIVWLRRAKAILETSGG